MFCDECGSQIRQGAKFCQKCGKAVSSQNISLTQKQIENNKTGKQVIRSLHVIASYEGKKDTIGFLYFQIFLLIILIITGFVFMLNNDFYERLFRSLRTSEKDFIRVCIWILIAVDFFTAIIKISKAAAINSTSLFITEQGIFGKAARETYTSVEEYTINYSDINFVNVKSDLLTLNTNNGDYKLLINYTQDAANKIWEGKKQLLNNLSNNSFGNSYNTSFQTETWRCPDCGKQNNNYVGTCGCGYTRNTRR